MNVLMISGDKHLLEEGSEAHTRLSLQRSQVDRLDVFVWPQMHTMREIMKVAKTGQYDVITAQDPFWRGLIAWRIARQTGAKLNIQIHTDLSAQTFFRRQLAYFVLHRANSVRVVSEHIRKQVQAVGVSVPVQVLPIYVDIRRFQGLQAKPHIQKTILWIGRLETEKDPSRAIVVLKEVRAKGIDAKLIMLGTGSLEASLRQQAKGLPVEFSGWHDPLSYLQVADVVLCTSRHESWGASMVEALAAGVPVAAPDVGVAREAGAMIATRAELSKKVMEILQQGTRGELRLDLPDAQEWAKHWKETLI